MTTADRGTCAICGMTMIICWRGQRAHPVCEMDGREDDEMTETLCGTCGRYLTMCRCDRREGR